MFACPEIVGVAVVELVPFLLQNAEPVGSGEAQ
jgi:hypothetical protein